MASRRFTKSSLEALNSYSSRLRRLTPPLPGARAISTYVASPSATAFFRTRTPYLIGRDHCDAVSATFLARHFHSSSPRLSAATASSSQANPTEFTEMAWEGIVGALEAAQSNKQQVVESEHLMKALLEQKDGLARRIFTKAGVDNSSVLQATDDFISKQPKVTGGTSGPVLGSSFASMLADARKNKKEMGDDFVSVEHLVLAFHSDPRFGQQLLKNLQLGEKDLKDAIKAVRGSQRVTDQNPEGKDQALEKYGNDLTELAKRGKLDPVIGRDDEIRRCIQILSRRTKNNPVIID